MERRKANGGGRCGERQRPNLVTQRFCRSGRALSRFRSPRGPRKLAMFVGPTTVAMHDVRMGLDHCTTCTDAVVAATEAALQDAQRDTKKQCVAERAENQVSDARGVDNPPNSLPSSADRSETRLGSCETDEGERSSGCDGSTRVEVPRKSDGAAGGDSMPLTGTMYRSFFVGPNLAV